MRLTRKPLVRIVHPIYKELFLTHSNGRVAFPVHSRMHLKTLLRTNSLSYKGKSYDINDFEAVPALSYVNVWLVALFWTLLVMFIMWGFNVESHILVSGCVFVCKLLLEYRVHTKDSRLAKQYNESSHIILLTKMEQK